MFLFQSPKKSIRFKLENVMKKNYFDNNLQKNELIHSNSDIYLNKIISPQKQSFEKIDSFNDINNQPNKDIINNKSYFYKPNNVFIGINIDPRNSNILSPKNISNKIYVNKNKNLGNFVQNEKIKTNSTKFFKENNNKGCNYNYSDRLKKRKNENYNSDDFLNINTNLSVSFLYKNNYIRDPVEIKFDNGFNINNIYSNTININDTKNNNMDKSSNNLADKRNKINKGFNTDLRIKSYHFIDKNGNLKSELYRNFNDLEKKSFELSKRKLKKNLSNKLFNFKKNENLIDVKQSFEAIKKSKSKKKNEKKSDNKLKIIKINNNNNNKKISDNKRNKDLSLNIINNNQFNWVYDPNFKIKLLKPNFWEDKKDEIAKEEQNISKSFIDYNLIKDNSFKSFHNNNFQKLENTFKNNTSKISKRNPPKNFPKNNFQINKSENKSNKTIEKISIDGFKINNNKTYRENKRKRIISSPIKQYTYGNKIPFFNENITIDYKPYDNFSYNDSYSSMTFTKNKLTKHIKVNTINTNYKKQIQAMHNNIPSLLKFFQNTFDKSNIIKGITNIEKIIKKISLKIIREFFHKLILKSEMNRYTLTRSHSNFSGLKYVKKVIPLNSKNCNKANPGKSKNQYSKEKIIKKNIFNVEKQKIILLKRKNFRAFEKYELCKDFIDNMRIKLIRYIFERKK